MFLPPASARLEFILSPEALLVCGGGATLTLEQAARLHTKLHTLPLAQHMPYKYVWLFL